MKFHFCQNGGMKSIPTLSFKRTCALKAISNESVLIHFILGKLRSHESLILVWNFISVKMTYIKAIPFWVLFRLNSCEHKQRADWTPKWDFQPKWNLIPVRVHFASHVNELLIGIADINTLKKCSTVQLKYFQPILPSCRTPIS